MVRFHRQYELFKPIAFLINKLPRLSLFSLTLLAAQIVQAHPGDEHKLSYLNQLVTQNKSTQSNYIKRGALYSKAGQYPLAISDFNTAQSLGDPILVSFELGVYYYSLTQYENAAEYFDRYLKVFPAYLPALEFRLKTARKMGQHQLAQQLFETLIGLSPYTNPGQYIAAAKFEISLNENQTASIELALSIIDAGIDRFGIIPQLQRHAIKLELQRKERKNAIIRHQTLHTVLAESPRWLIRHAELLIDNNQTDKAVPLLILAKKNMLELKRTPALTRLFQRLNKLTENPVAHTST